MHSVYHIYQVLLWLNLTKVNPFDPTFDNFFSILLCERNGTKNDHLFSIICDFIKCLLACVHFYWYIYVCTIRVERLSRIFDKVLLG